MEYDTNHIVLVIWGAAAIIGPVNTSLKLWNFTASSVGDKEVSFILIFEALLQNMKNL